MGLTVKWGEAEFQGLARLAEQVEALEKGGFDRICRQLAKEAARQLYTACVKRTPVGVPPDGLDAETRQQYWSCYTGGSLRRAWRISRVEKRGSDYVVEVENNSEYASYVEYGHRQQPGRYVPALGRRLKAGFVPGRFMMTLSVQEVEGRLPGMLEKKLYAKLKGAFEDVQ